MLSARSLQPTPTWVAGLGFFLSFLIVAWQPFEGGPRVPAALLALLGIWVLYKFPLHRSPLYQPVSLVFALLIVPAFLSLLSPLASKDSLVMAVSLLAYWMFAVGMTWTLSSRVMRDRLMRWLSLFYAFLVVDGVIQVIFGVDLLGVPYGPDFKEGRLLGPFDQHRYYGYFLAVLAPVVFWRFVADRPFAVAVALAVVALLITLGGSRSVLWMYVIGVVYMAWHFPRLRLYLLIAAVASAIAIVVAHPWSPIIQIQVAKFASFADRDTFDAFNTLLTDRLYIWHTALQMWADNLWVGIGGKNFSEVYVQYAQLEGDPYRVAPVSHAHHMYLGIAAEAGLIGLTGLLAIVYLLFNWYWASSEEVRLRARPWVGALLSFSFPLHSQPVLFKVWWFPFVVLILVMYINEVRAVASDDSE